MLTWHWSQTCGQCRGEPTKVHEKIALLIQSTPILYNITGRTPDLLCIFGNHLKPGFSRQKSMKKSPCLYKVPPYFIILLEGHQTYSVYLVTI